MDRDQAGVLGRRVLRIEDERLLTVGGTYVDDVQVPELTRAARVTFVRSPDDVNASPGYREHLARVLVARALEEAATRG